MQESRIKFKEPKISFIEEEFFPPEISKEAQDYFDLDEKSLSELIENLKLTHGHIQVLMHPFGLIDYDKIGKESDKIVRFEKYLETILKRRVINYFNVGKKNLPPVFLFVAENWKHSDFKIILARIEIIMEKELGLTDVAVNLGDLGIYLLGTFTDEGQPYFKDSNYGDKLYKRSSSSIDDPHVQKTWRELINIFDYIGVKHMTISGGYIGYWWQEGTISRCLGRFIRVLKPFYGINISNSSVYRDNLTREQIQNMGFQTKDTTK